MIYLTLIECSKKYFCKKKKKQSTHPKNIDFALTFQITKEDALENVQASHTVFVGINCVPPPNTFRYRKKWIFKILKNALNAPNS